jgi:hypothetical protein
MYVLSSSLSDGWRGVHIHFTSSSRALGLS